ncbi:hypothetical protein [Streptomyces sp. NPDC098090]
MVVQNSYEGLPPSYSRDMRAALETVDLDAVCSHRIAEQLPARLVAHVRRQHRHVRDGR